MFGVTGGGVLDTPSLLHSPNNNVGRASLKKEEKETEKQTKIPKQINIYKWLNNDTHKTFSVRV
eukprot:459946-Amphidinium_carterae.1